MRIGLKGKDKEVKKILGIILGVIFLITPFGLIAIYCLIGPGIAFGTIISLVNYIKSLKIVYSNSEYDETKVLYKIQAAGAIIGIVMIIIIAAFSVISIFYRGYEANGTISNPILNMICSSWLCKTGFFQSVYKCVMAVFGGIFDFYKFVILTPIFSPEVTYDWKL